MDLEKDKATLQKQLEDLTILRLKVMGALEFVEQKLAEPPKE